MKGGRESIYARSIKLERKLTSDGSNSTPSKIYKGSKEGRKERNKGKSARGTTEEKKSKTYEAI